MDCSCSGAMLCKYNYLPDQVQVTKGCKACTVKLDLLQFQQMFEMLVLVQVESQVPYKAAVVSFMTT